MNVRAGFRSRARRGEHMHHSERGRRCVMNTIRVHARSSPEGGGRGEGGGEGRGGREGKGELGEGKGELGEGKGELFR